MSAVTPTTKGARHQRIVDLVTQHEVRSQTELAALLADHGVHVTQATSASLRPRALPSRWGTIHSPGGGVVGGKAHDGRDIQLGHTDRVDDVPHAVGIGMQRVAFVVDAQHAVEHFEEVLVGHIGQILGLRAVGWRGYSALLIF